MAQSACDLSDKVILTSDNPRTEDPNQILVDMETGLSSAAKRKYITVIDRKEAIKTAVAMAKPEDIILVAGKGHEKYQDINGVKHPFDDKAVLQEFLNQTNL
jgi:UDP-N-acetylmuramoyl-L-alanyl-D-glutamate--2,6-diaminopimelate ligase